MGCGIRKYPGKNKSSILSCLMIIKGDLTGAILRTRPQMPRPRFPTGGQEIIGEYPLLKDRKY